MTQDEIIKRSRSLARRISAVLAAEDAKLILRGGGRVSVEFYRPDDSIRAICHGFEREAAVFGGRKQKTAAVGEYPEPPEADD